MWEWIHQKPIETLRLEVPGGWLYRCGTSTVFVPAPAEQVKPVETDMLDALTAYNRGDAHAPDAWERGHRAGYIQRMQEGEKVKLSDLHTAEGTLGSLVKRAIAFIENDHTDERDIAKLLSDLRDNIASMGEKVKPSQQVWVVLQIDTQGGSIERAHAFHTAYDAGQKAAALRKELANTPRPYSVEIDTRPLWLQGEKVKPSELAGLLRQAASALHDPAMWHDLRLTLIERLREAANELDR